MAWSRTPPLLCWSPQHQPVCGLDAVAPAALLSPLPLLPWPENWDFVDNTKLAVCHNPRIRRNKLFQGVAQRGGCTALGWFFGFKFHLPINHHGQIMTFKITGGNLDARQPLEPMTAALRDKVVGGRGYTAKSPVKHLWQWGLSLFTGSCRTMENLLLPLLDKRLLRKRSSIAAVLAQAKANIGTVVIPNFS